MHGQPHAAAEPELRTLPAPPSLQINWMRYISTMSHREEFKFAAELADSAMTIVYLLLGIVACEASGALCSLHPLPWCWKFRPLYLLYLPTPAPTTCPPHRLQAGRLVCP